MRTLKALIIAMETSNFSLSVRPSLVETTALGAAIAAGTAEGVHAWSAPHLGQQVDQLSADVFHPSIVESGK